MGRTVCGAFVVFAVLMAGSAHGDTGKQRGHNTDQIQLQEHVAGTITRIDGERLRVLEDPDPNGCAAGVRLVDIVEGTKLLRDGIAITEKDLQRGDRVAIEATFRGQTLEASEIRVLNISSTEHVH